MIRYCKISLIAATAIFLWFVVFLTVGAEWFLMWQSSSWNGQDAAGRMFMVMGIILIFIIAKDEERVAA